ncbi:metaxin-2 isoform X2 [Lycorma delicatula]|uniref:metaxin-2 isoform X2 n=1 Tax=Lycorma delicatula TaxID=130591 RepID=UPI003F517946
MNAVYFFQYRQTPWPDDVQLFQPDETSQILLPDSANCLSVQAYLKMCNLKYEVVYTHNAEDMSPSGKVPFIKCGAFLVPELDNIIVHVQSKDISLTADLDSVQKADMRAFMSLVNYILFNAELYITWCDPEVYDKVTWPRNSSVYPWPLCYILTYNKRQRILKRLKALHWYDKKSLEDVYVEVYNCCKALSDRLGDQNFFFGDKPTELDALVFAHIFTIISTPLPTNKFAGIIRNFSNIVSHCQRIEKMFFVPTNE